MRSSAQLKDSQLRFSVHGPHPDGVHEPRGFFQAVGFKNDVPYPEWGSKIFVGHLFPPGGEVLAPTSYWTAAVLLTALAARARRLPLGHQADSHSSPRV